MFASSTESDVLAEDKARKAFLGKKRFAWHAITHPFDALRWLNDKLFIRKSPIEQGLPLFSYSAIDYMRNTMRPGSRVFEWGSGGSTIFFAGLGCNVTSVEHDAGWVGRVKAAAHMRGFDLSNRIEIRHIPVFSYEERCDIAFSEIDRYLEQINDGAPWDYVLVDGIDDARISGIKKAMGLVNPGGFIALDDAWRAAMQCVPDILQGYERIIFKGFAPSCRSLHRIDVYKIV